MAIKKWIHLAEPWASTVHLNCFVTCTLQLNFCSFLMVLHNTLAYSVDKSCLTLRHFELYPSKFLCPWDFQSRILEWIAISFSRGSSHPRDEAWVSYVAGRFFTTETLGKPHCFVNPSYSLHFNLQIIERYYFMIWKPNNYCWLWKYQDFWEYYFLSHK